MPIIRTPSSGGSVDLSAPGPIGGTTPSTGSFTTVTLSGALNGSATGTLLNDGVDSLGGYGSQTATVAYQNGIFLRTTNGAVNVLQGLNVTGDTSLSGALSVAGSTVWTPANSVRAWGTITDTAGTGTGATYALVGSKNVSSVARHGTSAGTGQYDVTLTNAMPDTNYTVLVTLMPVATQTAAYTTTQFSTTVASRAMVVINSTTGFTIVCLNGATTPALQNPLRLSFCVFAA